jgi:hypothetical protein
LSIHPGRDFAVAGVLTAFREGPNVRFEMEFPPGFDHSFVVERLDVNPAGEQVWTPIHTGTSKFVTTGCDYEYARLGPDGVPVPLAGPRTYRALAYRQIEPDANVRVLHTEGVYTEPVTVD